MEIDGRNDDKEGNKERDVLDSLGEDSLADETKISIGNTENSLDPVADMIVPCTSEREEGKFGRENMDCSGSYITRKCFATQQTSDSNMLSMLKNSSNLMSCQS